MSGSLAHMSAPSPSRSSSPALAAANHQIPFNSAPVHHAPSPLGFGFGFGSSFGNNNAATSNPPTPSSSTTPQATSGFFAGLSVSPKRSEGKRRRDLDELEDDDEEMDSLRLRSGSDNWSHPQDRRMVLPKRMRAGLGFGPIHADPSPFQSPPIASTSAFTQQQTPSPFASTGPHTQASSSHSTTPKRPALADRNKAGMSMSGIDVDIGKMLASMDKASLLSMLTSLLSQSKDPSLAAQILSLLPTPSLDSVESSLDELEKAIRSAIPFSADGTTIRHEYTWSRLRGPIAAFTDAALGYLPFFVTELDSDREQRLRDKEPRLQANRDEVHPATTFTFLHMITSRVLRIESMLPPVPKSSLAFNLFTAGSSGTGSFGSAAAAAAGSGFNSSSKTRSPINDFDDAFGKHPDIASKLGNEFTSLSSPDSLMTVLMPQILKQWTTLLHRLDEAVNIDGRMFSQETVLGWARALESTTSKSQADHSATEMKAEEGLIRGAMDEVRGRLERDLAWLVRSAHYTNTTAPTRSFTKRDKRARGSSMSDEEEL